MSPNDNLKAYRGQSAMGAGQSDYA